MVAPAGQDGGATWDMQTSWAGPRTFGVSRNGVDPGSALKVVPSEHEVNGIVESPNAFAAEKIPTVATAARTAAKARRSLSAMSFLPSDTPSRTCSGVCGDFHKLP